MEEHAYGNTEEGKNEKVIAQGEALIDEQRELLEGDQKLMDTEPVEHESSFTPDEKKRERFRTGDSVIVTTEDGEHSEFRIKSMKPWKNQMTLKRIG